MLIGRCILIFSLESQHIVGGRQLEVVVATIFQLCLALPTECQVVAGGIERVLNDGRMVVLCNDARSVPLWFLPVGSSIGVLACRVGESDADAGAAVLQQWGLDAVDDGILVLQGGGGDVDGKTVGHCVRVNRSVVEL